jgi:hypothetical protein
MLRSILIGAGLLFCTSAMPICCTSDSQPAKESKGFEKTVRNVTVDIGLGYDVRERGGSRVATITNTTSEHVDGCIVFTNAEGTVISEQPGIIPAGGSMEVPVPDGADRVHVTDAVNCGDTFRGPVGWRTAAQAVPFGRHLYQDLCLIPDFSGEPNAEHHIFGDAKKNPAAFFQSARDLAEWGYRCDFSVQPGVTDVDAVLTEVIVNTGYDLELTVASNRIFGEIELWANGLPVMDKTAAYVPEVLGTGWDAWSFAVPAYTPEFNYDPTAGEPWENEVEFRFTRPGEADALYTLRRTLVYISD